MEKKSTELLDIMNDIGEIMASIEKARIVNDTIAELATPCNADESEQTRALWALNNQRIIEINNNIICDYLYKLDEGTKKLDKRLTEFHEKLRLEEEKKNGK